MTGSPRRCLVCSEPAVSLEHFIPAGIGGTRKLPILCTNHNGRVNEICDEPLVVSLAFFVHALRVRRDHGGDGIAIKGTDASGKTYVIDDKFVPQMPRTEILERDANRRPLKAASPSMEAANKLLKTMKIDPANAVLLEQFESAPLLNFKLELGGPSVFRGILKLAYEFIRGLHDVPSTDPAAEAAIHNVLLNGADPMPFVGWLPYEMLPGGAEATMFSHRIIAWYDGAETLVIVELFNCLPYIVRLPGMAIPRPELYIQGIHGGEQLLGTMLQTPSWTFNQVPLHPQMEMMPELQNRLKTIMESMTMMMFLIPTTESLGECFVANADVGELEAVAFVVAKIEKAFGRVPEPYEVEALEGLVRSILPYLKGQGA